MVTLLQVIVEGYCFIDPMNRNERKLQPFQEIKEVLEAFDKSKWGKEQDVKAIVGDDITQNLYQQLHNQFVSNILDLSSFSLQPITR